VNVLAIAGSLRADSSNTAFVRAVVALPFDDTTMGIYDGLGELPLFSPDLDDESPPSSVAALRSRLREADAVLICTPEYAYGMPGSLKNALDWLVSSGELYRKPVAALSASPSAAGGARALAWLRDTLAALNATVPPEASFAIPLVRMKLNRETIGDGEMIAKLRAAFAALRRAVDSRHR
jgi:chromate reductase, NAD(P)H dehydrogenase (quinone)